MIPFSVCMAVYWGDKPKDFETAVDSIYKHQTIKPNEIVLVVDGPVSDEMNKVIVRLQDKISCMRVLRFAENLGHAASRQAGLESASNELVAIMDADDLSLPDRFEKQLNSFALHPEASVIGGQITEFINSPDAIVGSRIVPTMASEVANYLKSRCPMNLVTVMVRKSSVQTAGGYQDWYCEEDYYLWIRMIQYGMKLINLSDTLVNVRVGKEMYRRRGGWKYFKSEERLQRYMLKHNMIATPRYLYNTLGRFVIQVAMPNRLRGFIFKKLFRKH